MDSVPSFQCQGCGQPKHPSERVQGTDTCWDCHADNHFPCDECGRSVRFDSFPDGVPDGSKWLCPACDEAAFVNAAPNL